MSTEDTIMTRTLHTHRILITRNTEYHLRGKECVAVRVAGAWDHQHRAVGTKLEGALGFAEGTGYRATTDEPAVGDRLCFSGDLMTSPLTQVRKPSKNTQAIYPLTAMG
jgi:hypothetical protein